MNLKEDRRHAKFLDLCLLHEDFDRPAYLESIRQWCIVCGNPRVLESRYPAFRGHAHHPRQSS